MEIKVIQVGIEFQTLKVVWMVGEELKNNIELYIYSSIIFYYYHYYFLISSICS